MGLDMYLTKKTYVKNWNYMTPEERTVVTVVPSRGIKSERISEIVEDMGYWRKANHIHKWFVDNVQGGNDDCGTYYVSEDNLKELLSLCKAVVNGEALPEADLPTTSGFFFGSTDYDKYYMQDIKETIIIIEACLAEEGGDYYYHSSW